MSPILTVSRPTAPAFVAPSTVAHTLSRRRCSTSRPHPLRLVPRAAATHRFRLPPARSPPFPTAPSPNSTPTPPPSALPDISKPLRWRLVLTASFMHALHATAVYMIPSTLLSPMRHSLALSVTEATRPLNIYRIVQASLLLPTGLLLDRLGPVPLLRAGMLLAAILAPLLAAATTLNHLIILQTLFAVSKLFAGLSTLLLLVAREFPDGKQLGSASSLLIAGYSFAGFLAPALIGAFSDRLGWRLATLLINVPFALAAMPLTMFLLRSRQCCKEHEDQEKLRNVLASAVETIQRSVSTMLSAINNRLFPSSSRPLQSISAFIPRSAGGAPYREPNSSSDPSDPVVTPQYAMLLTCVAAFSFSMHIIFDHLLVFLTEDLGIAFASATWFMSMLNMVSVGAKLTVGPISDRFSKPLLLVAFGVLGTIASCSIFTASPLTGLALTASVPRLTLFIITYSLAYSCIFSVTTSSLPELGRSKLGLRSNLNMMTLFLSGTAGSFLAGQTRAVYGSYVPAFASSMGCFVIVTMAAAAMYIMQRREAGRVQLADMGEAVHNEESVAGREKALVPLKR